MGQLTSRKRPWIAPLDIGPGHLDLRQVWRPLGWLAVLLGIGIILADPSTAGASGALPAVDPLTVVAVGTLGVLSILDAHYVAHARNAGKRFAEAAHDEHRKCHDCRRELDADLGFCHWCTTDVDSGRSPVSEDVNV